MKKGYKLLRNNLEKGPFTIDELMQQKLNPSDLIWVEGIGSAWAHPSEIDAIKNYTEQKTKQNSPGGQGKSVLERPEMTTRGTTLGSEKQVYVRPLSEEEDFEERADKLRKSILMHKPIYLNIPASVKKSGEQFLPVGENSIDLVYNLKEKNVYAPHLLIAAVLFALFIGGYYKMRLPLTGKTKDTNVPALPYVQEEPKQIIATAKENNMTPSMPEIMPQEPVIVLTEQKQVSQKRVTKVAKTVAADNMIKKLKEPGPAQKEPEITNGFIEQKEVVTAVEKESLVVEKKEDLKEDPSISTTEKKTFGKAIKSLFKKKHKEEIGDVSIK